MTPPSPRPVAPDFSLFREAVTLARSSGQGYSTEQLQRALAWGESAARDHGCSLPPFLVLDAFAEQASPQDPQAARWRDSSIATYPYDEWLDEFTARVQPVPAARRQGPMATTAPGMASMRSLALLVAAWPV